MRGRWRAAYAAVPADGVTWRASFKTGVEAKLPSTQAVIWSARFPGGGGWQSLPAWLPQEHVVWDVNLAWILAPPVVIARRRRSRRRQRLSRSLIACAV